MKSIFTLLLAALFTMGAFASDHRPSVRIRSNNDYQIVIDGRSVSSDRNFVSLDDLRYGRHSIEVYDVRRGFWGRRSHLISSSTFRLTDGDVFINIDRSGNIQVRDRGERFDNRWDNDNRDWSYGQGRDDRRWDNNNRGWSNDRDYNRQYHDDRDNK